MSVRKAKHKLESSAHDTNGIQEIAEHSNDGLSVPCEQTCTSLILIDTFILLYPERSHFSHMYPKTSTYPASSSGYAEVENADGGVMLDLKVKVPGRKASPLLDKVNLEKQQSI